VEGQEMEYIPEKREEPKKGTTSQANALKE